MRSYPVRVPLVFTCLLLLSACAANSQIVAPTATWQVVETNTSGPDGMACGVDHSGLGPYRIPGYRPGNLLIGYENTRTDARPRCRKHTGRTHHAILKFDLTPYRGDWVPAGKRIIGARLVMQRTPLFVPGLFGPAGLGLASANSDSDLPISASPSAYTSIDGRA